VVLHEQNATFFTCENGCVEVFTFAGHFFRKFFDLVGWKKRRKTLSGWERGHARGQDQERCRGTASLRVDCFGLTYNLFWLLRPFRSLWQRHCRRQTPRAGMDARQHRGVAGPAIIKGQRALSRGKRRTDSRRRPTFLYRLMRTRSVSLRAILAKVPGIFFQRKGFSF